MDDDGGLGPLRNWGYYEQPMKGNLGLQLMSHMAVERDTKPLLSNGGFPRRDLGVAEPSIPMEFMREGWMHHGRDMKPYHSMQLNHYNPHTHHPHHPSYAVLPPEPPGPHTLQMVQPPDLPKEEESPPPVEKPKKRSQARANKPPKVKKPKKVAAPRDDENNGGSVPRGRAGKKSEALVINGLDLDLSVIPTPVCSCTGAPQQCYRWGVGGWQSACCTTNMSAYPLPVSMKRRGARIPGRKMSQGAFIKVLEKLAGEGYNLNNLIDLKTFWAKHGTNKFVTIR